MTPYAIEVLEKEMQLLRQQIRLIMNFPYGTRVEVQQTEDLIKQCEAAILKLQTP